MDLFPYRTTEFTPTVARCYLLLPSQEPSTTPIEAVNGSTLI